MHGMTGQIDREDIMIINKEIRDDILVMWLLIDKYYVYQIKFKWHDGAENWVIKSLEMVAVLDHHVGLCSENKVSK